MRRIGKKIGVVSDFFLPEGPMAHVMIKVAFREFAKGGTETTNAELKDFFKNPPNLPDVAYITVSVTNGMLQIQLTKKTAAKKLEKIDPKTGKKTLVGPDFVLNDLRTYAIDLSDLSVWNSVY